MDILKRFVSKKLFVAILTPILLAINNHLPYPIEPEVLNYLIATIAVYLFGQAAVDVVHEVTHKDER